MYKLFSSLYWAFASTLKSFIYYKFFDGVIAFVSSGAKNLAEISNYRTFLSLIILRFSIMLVEIFIRRYDFLVDKYIRNKTAKDFERLLDIQVASVDMAMQENNDFQNDVDKAYRSIYIIFEFFNISMLLITEFFSFVISFIICLNISWIISIVGMLFATPRILATLWFIREIYGYYDKNTEKFRRTHRLEKAITYKECIEENKITKADNYFISVSKSLRNELLNDQFRILNKEFWALSGAELIRIVNNIIVFLFSLNQLITGKVTIGGFTFISGKLGDVSYDFDSFIERVNEYYENLKYIEDVKKIFDTKQIIKDGHLALDSTKPFKIEFKNVWFKYPKTKKYVLKGINMVINPYDEIAIVGNNGEGKTTLIKLILRFYDVTKGEILINDKNIKEYKLSDYYKCIGSLMQDYNIFSDLSPKKRIFGLATLQNLWMTKS